MKRIYTETNWLPKEAMKQVLILGIHSELSMLSNYTIAREFIRGSSLFNLKKYLQLFYARHYERQNSHTKGNSGNDSKFKPDQHKNLSIYLSGTPDGYMIIQHLQKFIFYSHKDWKRYLSSSSVLPDVLRQEILQGKVHLENPKLYNRHWLIPYNVTEISIFQKGFHNIGQPYYWEEPNWLKGCSVTSQFQDTDTFYYCMVLPGYLQRTGVRIKLFDTDLKIANPSFELTFVGPLIGISNNNLNRDGFALWSDIRISWFCHTTQFSHNLPNIGWKHIRHYPDRAKKQAEQLTAPLILKIPMVPVITYSKETHHISCKKEDIKKIELTFNHTHYPYGRMHSSKRIELIWHKY